MPSLCEDLLSSVDQPLKIARDRVVGKDYLLCDYNRDGDSYRLGLEIQGGKSHPICRHTCSIDVNVGLCLCLDRVCYIQSTNMDTHSVTLCLSALSGGICLDIVYCLLYS